MNEEVKKDNRPSTEQWYKTVIKIKDFCEGHDMQVSDTEYGWLATFFYKLRDDL